MCATHHQEDAEILFDRNYPPPLISLDLDLKNAFQVRSFSCSFAFPGRFPVFQTLRTLFGEHVSNVTHF